MSTKKLQILGSLGNKVYVQKDVPMNAPEGSVWVDLEAEYEESTLNADTIDGKHASAFALASDTVKLQNEIEKCALKSDLVRIDSSLSTKGQAADAEAVGVLKARMDTFTALAEGSTTGDAELQDIRIGYDETVYDTAGNAVREQINKLQNEIESCERVKYGNTPFWVIDHTKDAMIHARSTYRQDGSNGTLENCSLIYKCPKYFGFKILDDTTKMYLYIGNMVNNKFVFDLQFVFNSTAAGTYNYFGQAYSRIVETDGTKYFYYQINDPSKVEFIGCDEFPACEFDNIDVIPYCSNNEGELKNMAGYSSIVIPNDCYYAIFTKNHENYNRASMNVAYEEKGYTNNAGKHVLKVIPGGASFGYIPKGENIGAAMLRFPVKEMSDDGSIVERCTLDDISIYVSTGIKSNTNSGKRKVAKDLAIKLIKDFKFISQKEITWSGSTRSLAQGKLFHGVPYSSRWRNSHFIGFEVSPETALNALNDPYSIAYDGGFVYYTVTDADGNPVLDSNGKEVTRHRRENSYNTSNTVLVLDDNQNPVLDDEGNPIYVTSEVPSKGGTGYGLVCSAFTSLINGNPYPQTNRGFTFDDNFSITWASDMNSGMCLSNKKLSHVVFVDEIYDNNGFSLYEGIQPCIAKTVHTSELVYDADGDGENDTDIITRTLKTDTSARTLDNYIYSVVNRDTSGYKTNMLKFDNISAANGSIRPWRGNKCVYGPWDKSEKGTSIGITIHDGASTAYLVTPSKTVELSVSGLKYLDISEHVTEYGTYELYSDVSGIKEYFRYCPHAEVTLDFDADGKAIFSSDDVEYAYVGVVGYGGDFNRYIDTSDDDMNNGEPIVIAKGKYYPDLAADKNRIKNVYAAIVSDHNKEVSDYECWGKYSCVCTLG